MLITINVCTNQIFSLTPTSNWQGVEGVQFVMQWRETWDLQTNNTPATPEPCTSGGSLSDAFVATDVTSPVDARIKSALAQSYGAGTSTLTGTLTSPGPDMFGQSRTSRVDLGAIQFSGGSPSPPAPIGPGRLPFRADNDNWTPFKMVAQ
jgi:hypothetical protein